MTYSRGSAENMNTDPALVELIPSDRWSLPYLKLPGILIAASRINPVRVGEVCAASQTDVSHIPPITNTITPTAGLPIFRISAPTITPCDGQASTLPAFCFQLLNQIKSCQNQFLTESSKVQFAYQFLGPEALLKMRSLFRCLEDPTVPQEIKSFSEILSVLKQ
ncbi:hypothetical protein EV44_g3784 [Erysiphe necator]|uniref:Uncharacterized protein n=1 Tax=Uncinula necator TaxID=52586 RepID=A0A0B1P179_UNCNE|nr:hypothetical protein EV44_g3784 [Erysiphe necator]